MTDSDGGFSLVEAMVGLLLLTVGLLALLTEITTYIRTQGAERAQAQAVRVLSTTLEDARAQESSSLLSALGVDVTLTPSDVGGDYEVTTELVLCTAGDPADSCTAPTDPRLADPRLTATVRWTYAGKERELTSSTSIADRSDATYSADASGSLDDLLGANGGGGGLVTVQTLSASPSTLGVNASGQASSSLTLTVQAVGLSGVTSIPVTWTDDTGSHQTTLLGGPSTFSGTILAGTITKAPGTGPLTFTAVVPGTDALTTVDVPVTQTASLTGCSYSPAPIQLGVLTGKTTSATTLTCTASGLAATDAVSVTHTKGLGTQTRALTSTDGGTWSVVLPTGTQLGALGAVTTFTFVGTHASGTTTPVVLTSVLGL